MELKTDGAKFFTREDFRKACKKVMHNEMHSAMAGILMCFVENESEIRDLDRDERDELMEKMKQSTKDALHLQVGALKALELELFGAVDEPKKKEEKADE